VDRPRGPWEDILISPDLNCSGESALCSLRKKKKEKEVRGYMPTEPRGFMNEHEAQPVARHQYHVFTERFGDHTPKYPFVCATCWGGFHYRKSTIHVVRYCLFSGILASCRLLLILGRTLAYHSQASRTTSPSASNGVGISEYPGRAVGCRRYTVEQVGNETSRYAGMKTDGVA